MYIPGPGGPGAPPGAPVPAAALPSRARAGLGGVSLGAVRPAGGDGGSGGATTCLPHPIRLRPEPRDPPRASQSGPEVLFGVWVKPIWFDWGFEEALRSLSF